jgi:hypothetical protein
VIARAVWSDVCFAFIVRFAFWFGALVIEGSALNLPQAFRERLDPKLFSLAYLSRYVLTRRRTSLPSSQNYK